MAGKPPGHRAGAVLFQPARAEENQVDLTARRRFTNRYEESLAHLEEGLSRLESGDVPGAIEKLEAALRCDRENTLALGNLGLIYHQLGQLERAEESYRSALAIEPADPWLHRGLGGVYETQGRWEQAQKEYRRAIELDPQDALARYALGNALLAERKLEAAVDAFCDALEIDPTLDAARNRLAAIYRGRGMNAAALEQYAIVAQRNRGNQIGEVALQRQALIGQLQWPMARRDPARTAHEPALLTSPLSIHWQFDTPGEIATAPIMFNGVVYLACQSGRDGAGVLLALDGVTGEELWRFTVPRNHSISSTPAAHDGLVLLGTNGGIFYALDAAIGRVAWQFETRGAIRAAPAVAGNLVYFGSDDRCLYALALLTGQERWHLETGGAVTMAPAVDRGRVFASAGDRRFRAVDARTGTELWSANIGEAACPPVVSGPTVFVPTRDCQLYALVATSGERRWSARFKPGRDGFSELAAWEGRLYLTYGNVLAALDIISGQIEWEVALPDVAALKAPALAGQLLYVTSTTPGRLYAFDIARGRRRWQYDLPQTVVTSPVISQRALLIGTTATPQETTSGLTSGAKLLALGPL